MWKEQPQLPTPTDAQAQVEMNKNNSNACTKRGQVRGRGRERHIKKPREQPIKIEFAPSLPKPVPLSSPAKKKETIFFSDDNSTENESPSFSRNLPSKLR